MLPEAYGHAIGPPGFVLRFVEIDGVLLNPIAAMCGGELRAEDDHHVIAVQMVRIDEVDVMPATIGVVMVRDDGLVPRPQSQLQLLQS